MAYPALNSANASFGKVEPNVAEKDRVGDIAHMILLYLFRFFVLDLDARQLAAFPPRCQPTLINSVPMLPGKHGDGIRIVPQCIASW